MTTTMYRDFFRSMGEIVTLYVGLLALIGLLASVGFFKLRLDPNVRVLEPTYAFDMPQLIKAYETYAHGAPLPEEWRSISNQFATYRKPPIAPLPTERVLSSAMLPFQETSAVSDTNFPAWAKPSNPVDLFYHLGITNKPGTREMQPPNFSAKRSDVLKRYGIGIPMAMNWARLAMQKGIGQWDYRLKENPLIKLQEIIPQPDPPQWADAARMDLITEATFVYSIVSVANYSSQPLENVKLSVPNSIWSGPVTLVGWSDLPQSVDSVEKSQGYHITIERLEPQQSLEIVFRGHKLLRESEMSVSASWSFDKAKIGTCMCITLVLVVVLYFGDVLVTKGKRFVRCGRAS